MITIYLQWISLHTRSLRLADGDNRSANIGTVSISKLEKIINMLEQLQLKYVIIAVNIQAVSSPVVL